LRLPLLVPAPVDAKALADWPTDNPKRASIWTAAFGENISLLVEEKFPVPNKKIPCSRV
jgi:hypothetical protein